MRRNTSVEHCLKVLDLCERWCLSLVSGHDFVYCLYICVCFGSLAHRLWVILDHNQVSHELFLDMYVPVVPSRQLAALAWGGSLPPALGQCFSFMHRPLAPAADPPGGPGASYVTAALSPIASRYRCATATARAACLH